MTREEVKTILKEKRFEINTRINGETIFSKALGFAIEALEQEPKTGQWITQWNVAHQKEYYYCSECREEFSYDGETGIKMNEYDFCPNCGAKMKEVIDKYKAEGSEKE